MPTWKPAKVYTLRRRATTATAHKTTPAAPPKLPIQRNRVSTLPHQGGSLGRSQAQATDGLRPAPPERAHTEHGVALGGCLTRPTGWTPRSPSPRAHAARIVVSPGGETGRHKGLKIPRRRKPPCRFESGPGHHKVAQLPSPHGTGFPINRPLSLRQRPLYPLPDSPTGNRVGGEADYDLTAPADQTQCHQSQSKQAKGCRLGNAFEVLVDGEAY